MSSLEIDEWLASADAECLIGLRQALLGQKESMDVTRAVMARFVKGNPRAWWMSINSEDNERRTIDLQHGTSGIEQINNALGDFFGVNASVYFIPEREETPYHVYRLNVEQVIAVLKGCPSFEYYVVNLDLSRFAAESDHGILYLIQKRVA